MCSETAAKAEQTPHGWILPVRTVGVQGDSRTYRHVLAVDGFPPDASDLVNSDDRISRIAATVWTSAPLSQLTSHVATIDQERLTRLQAADAIVRRLSLESGFESEVWQFPVVLIPFGTPDAPDSVVLRPIFSVDGMTASSVRMPDQLLARMVEQLRTVPGIAGIFYDLTNKPPATIEWE